MVIGAVAETRSGERRVALTPGVVNLYAKRGWTVRVQAGAGVAASFLDEEYAAGGALVVPDREALFDGANVVVGVAPPTLEEVESLPTGVALVSHLDPLGNPALAPALASRGVVAFAVELVPRITRAQGMDALSSQATVAGYKAVLVGANRMTRFLPMLTTAAGTIRPAKAMILGAGVAGLQAIATARRLGAVVSAFDIRPAAKEQVESLGARFLDATLTHGAEDSGGYARELTAEQQQRDLAVIAQHLPGQDLVVTTAQVPGRPAPVLITEGMVRAMRPGSVIVDLASESGGNCALTVSGETVVRDGVTVVGPANLASELPFHASQMYARNVASLVGHIYGGNGQLDPDDEITSATCLTREGDVTTPALRSAPASGALTPEESPRGKGTNNHG